MTQTTEIRPATATLAELREARGLTRREMAARLDVTPPTIYKWEYGDAWPTIPKLPRMAEVLGVSITTLVLSLTDERGGGSRGAIRGEDGRPDVAVE